MDYICKTCNKKYKSYQSLWNHNHKYHNTNDNHCDNHNNHSDNHVNNHNNHSDNLIKNSITKKYCCGKCDKEFSQFQNRWRHEKSCKETNNNQNNNDNLKLEIIELKNKVQKLEKKSNIKTTTNIKVNGNLFNGNNKMDVGPKIIINKTGNENMDQISYNEVSTIFDNEISSVVKLIELVNFSENKPENHSFCSTALESPYLSFYNTDTNTINKERKRYFFEDVICKSIQNHEILYSKFKNKFNSVKRKQIEDNIENLKMIKANSFNSKIIGEMIRNLNLISYNKRDLIQDTWSGSNKKYDHDSDEEFMAMLLDDPKTQAIIKAETEAKANKKDYNSSLSDSEEERPVLLLPFSNRKKASGKNKEINL